jgi:hypothetical protein
MTRTKPVEGRMSVHADAIRFIVGGIFGWMIWWASPGWTGEIEPWDSLGSYYSTSLVAAGFISTLFWPAGWYWGPLGIYAGQVAYVNSLDVLHLPAGPADHFSVEFAVLAVALFGTLQSIVGGLMGMGVGLAVARVFKNRS